MMEPPGYDHLFQISLFGDDVLARTSLMRAYNGEELDLSYVRSNIGECHETRLLYTTYLIK